MGESSHRSKNPAAAIDLLLGEVACFLCADPSVDCHEFGAFGEELDTWQYGELCSMMVVGALEQITMASTGASATPGEKSNFHTALEECLPLGHDIVVGDCSGAGCSMEQKSEYFSTRVEEMMRSKSQFSSDVEREIEHSRVHWSEVSSLTLEENNLDEEVSRENREVFVDLLNDPQWENHEYGHFFPNSLFYYKLGRKIAEGGQATIFEVIDNDGKVSNDLLLKVFKRGSRLADLKKQWPLGVLQKKVMTCVAFRGYMLEVGRFAFTMERRWGDLRKLIDQAMQEKNNQGPPFPYEWNGKTLHAKYMMREIAQDMIELHKQGIIHRDLKAANVLLLVDVDGTFPIVADYECSIGVVGTGFWRAPEILLALKQKSVPDFSKKVDVYSYGMTCLEVVTSRLPFEGELEDCRKSRDLVIEGRRPQLPSDLDVPLKDLIERCWNPNPNERPSFEENFQILDTL